MNSKWKTVIMIDISSKPLDAHLVLTPVETTVSTLNEQNIF